LLKQILTNTSVMMLELITTMDQKHLTIKQ